MKRFTLLDLFCGAGGASAGYAQAGFEVTGVDLTDQPNYPYLFIKGDVLQLSASFLRQFDAIHASPPCQRYSVLAKRTGNGDAWPDLVGVMRDRLNDVGQPWIIENVVGAPLSCPILLCGTMFPGLRVIRHRLFESNVQLTQPFHCPRSEHPLIHTWDKRKRHYGKTCEWKDFVQVTGGGHSSVASAQDAMGIPWMTKRELNEAIPPAYTALLGEQLMERLRGTNQRQREDPPLFAYSYR